MPNRTIYVKEADLPLFERAQEELGESISALFSDFLRHRLANSTEAEKKVLDFIKAIQQEKQRLKQERTPAVVLREYEMAEGYARQVFNYLKVGNLQAARNLWFGAESCRRKGDRHVVDWQDLRRQLAQAMGG